MAIFKGAGVAIVTPMNEDLSVNFDKLGELIEEQIAGGTDAIIICGTTGESSTLTHGEHLRAIKYTIDKVAKRMLKGIDIQMQKIAEREPKFNPDYILWIDKDVMWFLFRNNAKIITKSVSINVVN